MTRLPDGTVTFLFSDIEGSTRLLERNRTMAAAAMAHHVRVFEEIVGERDGAIFETVGDAVYAAFGRAADAVAAALEAQSRLSDSADREAQGLAVRIALHTGEVELRGEHYFGPALFRTARLETLAHGGQILASGVTAALVRESLPDGAALRDLGSHRLKDLGEPEHVFQLAHPTIRNDFPPLKGLDAHPHNLPVQLSSFVGRASDVAAVEDLLQRHRLVTLIGPGGVGKTRLALQVAADVVERYDDGAFFVDLQDLRDAALLPAAIGSALGLADLGGMPAGDALRQAIGSREMLLVLDNIEQLLPAAATTVSQLLKAGPGLSVMATSRAPLRVSGEQEYEVSPLSARSGRGQAGQAPAVALFVERARALRPELVLSESDRSLIGEICVRLDGLPLAIELAAARLRLFSVAALNERLGQRLPLLTGGARDLPDRQQTLRSAIGWSEELLVDEERLLFRYLAVFRGGFTAEAAEAIAPERVVDPTGVLGALIEHSLLRQVGGVDARFTMLETIGEFARERLEAAGELEQAAERHLGYFVRFAERAYEERLVSASRWFPLVELEHHNLRTALEWAEPRDPRLGAQLLGAIAYHWTLQGHVREVLERGEALLPRHRDRDATRARLLTQVAEAIRRRGTQQEHGIAYADEALDIYSRLADVVNEAHALVVRGDLRVAVGDHATARLDLHGSMERMEAAGAPELQAAESLTSLAHLHIAMGDVERAEPMVRRLFEVGRRSDSRLEQVALHYLADLPLIGGEFAEAERRYRHALASARRLQMSTQVTNEVLGVAMALAGQGRDEPALRLAAAAHARRRALGLPGRYLHWWDEQQQRHFGAARERLGATRAAEAEAAGESADFDSVVDQVLASGAKSATPAG